MTKRSNPEVQKEWEKRIANFRFSGLTQDEWCEENKLTSNQLKYWLRKIEGSKSERKSNPKWVPIVLDETDDVSNDTLEIKVGTVSIEVKPGFSPSLLAEVVKVLKTTC
ncbi:hypothetical protein BABA_02137 [Neobacillus bataviensis LMG 21833]|uniref:Transposase n=1 Tax=Neobacillus bataviensis LMG 21833 TaxID=1117379 RepID=K6CJH4_9BACI|nr:hypothetical protein [Neobacillus bataviensis]EKN71320.1 hypothetical protein BABA_02137 [Neobacillus bataviensis LMG 21833]